MPAACSPDRHELPPRSLVRLAQATFQSAFNGASNRVTFRFTAANEQSSLNMTAWLLSAAVGSFSFDMTPVLLSRDIDDFSMMSEDVDCRRDQCRCSPADRFRHRRYDRCHNRMPRRREGSCASHFSPADPAGAVIAALIFYIDGVADHEALRASKVDVEGSVEGKADHILVG